MPRKIGRLFVIKTRFEAWLVIYAIALGAVERGRLYLDTYPGLGGWLLALACTGVVFLAGGKLLDSVRRAAAGDRRRALSSAGPRAGCVIGRNRPRRQPTRRASERHGFHAAQIDAGPGHRPGAGDGGANVERAIGIAEIHRAARARRRRRAERLPSSSRRGGSTGRRARAPVPLTSMKFDAPAGRPGQRRRSSATRAQSSHGAEYNPRAHDGK